MVYPDHAVEGTWGAEFHANCLPTESDIIVSKGVDPLANSHSAFGDAPEVTPLLADLQAKGVNKLFVVGLVYDYCVGATALDGVKNGLRTYVVTDGTKSFAAETEEAMDKKLQEAGVQKITSEEVLSH